MQMTPEQIRRIKELKKFGGNPMHTRLVVRSERVEKGPEQPKPVDDTSDGQNRSTER